MTEAAAGEREALGVEEGKTGLELPGERVPVVVGQADHGMSRLVAGGDGEAVGGRRVGVGPAVVEPEGDGPDHLQIGGGEDPGPVGKAAREFLEVEPVEVDGSETIRGHCPNVPLVAGAGNLWTIPATGPPDPSEALVEPATTV